MWPILQDSLGYLVKLWHKEKEKEEEVKGEAEAGRERRRRKRRLKKKRKRERKSSKYRLLIHHWPGLDSLALGQPSRAQCISWTRPDHSISELQGSEDG